MPTARFLVVIGVCYTDRSWDTDRVWVAAPIDSTDAQLADLAVAKILAYRMNVAGTFLHSYQIEDNGVAPNEVG